MTRLLYDENPHADNAPGTTRRGSAGQHRSQSRLPCLNQHGLTMTVQDEATLNFYSGEARAYTSRKQGPDRLHLELFLSALPVGSAILELGCGGGQDSELMIARGFDVTPTDGTPEIAQIAEKRLGRPVIPLLFGDLNNEDEFHGIWANACLLHVPRPGLPSIIGRVHKALKKGGVFYASFKGGTGEGRDQFDRYYNYPSAEWLQGIYASFQWQAVEIKDEIGSGYDRKPTNWLHVTATKSQ